MSNEYSHVQAVHIHGHICEIIKPPKDNNFIWFNKQVKDRVGEKGEGRRGITYQQIHLE